MKKIIQTDNAPRAIGPYSQGVEHKGMLFISGQIPIDPVSGKVIEGGISNQTDQVLKNLQAVLKAAGYSLENVVKTTCLLSDMNNFQAMNDVYAKYFPDSPPARAAYQVCRLPLGVDIEIEAIAVKE